MTYVRLLSSVASCLLLFGCTYTYGKLDTNNRFAFPNSDVQQTANSHVSLEASSTQWIWQDPPNRRLYEELLTGAISRTKGDLLINTVWITETTTYPLPVPIYTVKMRLNATAVNAEIYEKRLY